MTEDYMDSVGTRRRKECEKGNHQFMPGACPFEGMSCVHCGKGKGDGLVRYHDQYTNKRSMFDD